MYEKDWKILMDFNFLIKVQLKKVLEPLLLFLEARLYRMVFQDFICHLMTHFLRFTSNLLNNQMGHC